MRMVKMQQETLTLEEAVQKFLMEKDAQHTGAAAMTDYRNCLARFVKSSHNSIEYDLLDADVLAFFSSIPDTSPARYNKPFQNVNAFLNWILFVDAAKGRNGDRELKQSHVAKYDFSCIV